ncbi:MAG: LysR family transcriptional regulator [Ruminococcaceae bacterium]|jgi:DNA-binding transcriptional LysR family regulator|nr:LysR family transcriptional regulator [Oscillospiraceae bacterium]
MDTKKFEAMVTAVTQGSFTRAADMLGYTQSGLTHMMNALEGEVGFRLLERGHFGIRLTPDGARIMPLIHQFLEASDRLSEEIRAINDQANVLISVGAFASIATHWLPAILDRFRSEYPNVQVTVQDGPRDRLFADVIAGRFDLAFTSVPKGENVDWYPLHEDPLLALLPKTAYGERYEKFAVEDYAGTEFLMPAFGNAADILAVLNSHNVHPEILTTMTSNQALISMVAHGLGVSMLSELSIRGYEQSVCALPLSPAYARTLGIITRKNAIPKPTVARLIACAHEVIGELYGEKA